MLNRAKIFKYFIKNINLQKSFIIMIIFTKTFIIYYLHIIISDYGRSHLGENPER